MNFKPNKNRVLVEYDKPDTHMGSGLIMVSEWRREKPNRGIVVAVGETDNDFPPQVLTKVELHPQHNGIEMSGGGKEYVLVHIENILGTYVD